MTDYLIQLKFWSCWITIDSEDIIISAGSQLKWALGKPLWILTNWLYKVQHDYQMIQQERI